MDTLDHMKLELVALLPRLRRFAKTLTHNAPDADDLVQDACLRAIARHTRWDPSQPLDRWMFRMLRNLWISDLRKRQVRTGKGLVAAEEAPELITLEGGESAVLHRDLSLSISDLPSELGSVLLLVAAEGYSYRETAELLSIPIGTVMSRLYRARHMLAARLTREDASECAASKFSGRHRKIA